MKSTGIVRKLDELGRITLPMELRRTLGIGEREQLEIYTEEDKIVLKKYVPSTVCKICGSTQNVKSDRNGEIAICDQCTAKIKELFGE